MPPTENSAHPSGHVPVVKKIVDPAVPADNHIIVIIKHHPFGLVVQYLGLAFALLVSFGLLFYLLPSVVTESTRENMQLFLSIATVVVSAMSALFLLIATYLYRQNRWVVTDDSITQVLRNGIFGSHISGLSLANIEDVTSERQGLLAHLFGFGSLKVETAGEQGNKFHFNYCPKPDFYAKILLEAREQFIHKDPHNAKRTNELLNVPSVGGQS